MLFGILIELCVDGLVMTTSHAHSKLSGFRRDSLKPEQWNSGITK